MKKSELKANLETGNYFLFKNPGKGGTWSLVDRRNRIPCAGKINPQTAEELNREFPE